MGPLLRRFVVGFPPETLLAARGVRRRAATIAETDGMLDFGDTRTRAGFHLLVRTTILKAAYVAATRVGAYVPRRFSIEVRGSMCDGTYDDLADVTDVLFREDGLVARAVDVAVGNIRGEFADVRVIVVDAGPCRFAESLNQPKGYGPFRVIHWEIAGARDDPRGAFRPVPVDEKSW